MEDQADDSDIQLQRDSAAIVEELDTSIPLFVYRDVNADQPSRIRKWIKRSNTAKLESLFNAFQEWPQLLDTTLRRHVEPLVSAFKEYVQRYSDHYPISLSPSGDAGVVEPIPRAICKLLYTLCKVRGARVISIFFSNEPSLLEPMLDAFEKWNNNLTWKEKYVMLLWLSHLTQTPFDLASISSPDSSTPLDIPLPSPLARLPTVANRLLVLGIRYVVSSSKEQEAAKVLLVHLCMRPDMDRLGLKARCMDWVLQSLSVRNGSEQVSIYSTTGILSFLAGFFKSCDNIFVAPFIIPVLDHLQDVIASDTEYAKMAYGSAVVRKLLIKIHRASAIHLLSGCLLPPGSDSDEVTLLDNIIDHLMTSLRDMDNPVRFSASKALSIIAQKLDPDMVEQLLDGLVERLQEDVVFTATKGKEVPLEQDLATADPLQWQGLILTLSHLLFRQSAPKWKLTMVVGLLVKALDFEQRSPMGASIGSGVRDAACFGVWSLARKYTTEQLSQVAVAEIRSRNHADTYASVFRLLAAELVVTATLDPEGNIRRAASAALQELVGRHPHEVPNGIDLVQIVDYQAVGLRSRAMSTVAAKAASLNSLYLHAVSDGLLSWRAINSPDAAIRRRGADVVGEMFRVHGAIPLLRLQQMIESSQVRSLDEWHGLHLAFTAVLRQDPSIATNSRIIGCQGPPESSVYLLRRDGPLSDMDVTTGRKARLAVEALCAMVSALGAPSAAAMESHGTGTPIGDGTDLKTLEYHMGIIESSFEHGMSSQSDIYRAAPVVLFNQLNQEGQKSLLVGWSRKVIDTSTRHNPEAGAARIVAIGSILQKGLERQTVFHDCIRLIYDALLLQLHGESHWLAKVAALDCLYTPVYLIVQGLRGGFDTQALHQALLDCLDDRSIVNSREVGSEVRIQAIGTIESLRKTAHWTPTQRVEIFGRVYGLAVEKLDKVRDSAWHCIREYPDAVFPKTHPCIDVLVTDPMRMASLSTSSPMYFDFVFVLCNDHRMRTPIIRGLITSASSGGEALLGAARLSISKFVTTSSPVDVRMLYQSLLSIIGSEMPAGRLLWPGLEVLAFLLDIDVVPRLTEPIDLLYTKSLPRSSSSSTQWHALLDGMAPLHKGSNLRNWDTIIQVYAGLARYDSLRYRVTSMLQQVLAHRKFPMVRLAAAAALFVIQPNAQLKTVDFSTPISSAVKKQVETAYGDDTKSR